MPFYAPRSADQRALRQDFRQGRNAGQLDPNASMDQSAGTLNLGGSAGAPRSDMEQGIRQDFRTLQGQPGAQPAPPVTPAPMGQQQQFADWKNQLQQGGAGLGAKRPDFVDPAQAQAMRARISSRQKGGQPGADMGMVPTSGSGI